MTPGPQAAVSHVTVCPAARSRFQASPKNGSTYWTSTKVQGRYVIFGSAFRLDGGPGGPKGGTVDACALDITTELSVVLIWSG